MHAFGQHPEGVDITQINTIEPISGSIVTPQIILMLNLTLIISCLALTYLLIKNKRYASQLSNDVIDLQKLARFSKELLFRFDTESHRIEFFAKGERTNNYLVDPYFDSLRTIINQHLQYSDGDGVVVITHQSELEYFVLKLVYLRPSDKSNYIIGKIIDVKEEIQTKDLLIEKSRTDSLTQLYNAGYTRDTIKDLIQNKIPEQRDALLLFDLDGFKDINDTLGHLKGDVALQEVAKALRVAFHEATIVGRIGGDEFMVYMENISFDEHHCPPAEDFLRKLSEVDFPMPINSSVGVCIISNQNDFEEACSLADAAMYCAKKEQGTNRIRVVLSTHEVASLKQH